MFDRSKIGRGLVGLRALRATVSPVVGDRAHRGLCCALHWGVLVRTRLPGGHPEENKEADPKLKQSRSLVDCDAANRRALMQPLLNGSGYEILVSRGFRKML